MLGEGQAIGVRTSRPSPPDFTAIGRQRAFGNIEHSLFRKESLGSSRGLMGQFGTRGGREPC